MVEIDEAALRRHIGAKMTAEDVATAYPLRALAAALGRDEPAPGEGSEVPPGWHGLFFLSTEGPESLGPDGLAVGAGVLPPMPFPRRMFAGERLRFHKPIRVGDRLTRETELLDIRIKQGRTGTLGFTTQIHRYFGPDGLCIEEERDGVFREEVPAGAGNPSTRRDEPPADLPWRREVTMDTVTLFRFSALTFNGHRIHYDRTHAMEVEGYPGLVVHGPLASTLLHDFARDHNPGRSFAGFHMRARAPLFDVAPFTLQGRPNEAGDGCDLWAVTPEGTVAMSAGVNFA